MARASSHPANSEQARALLESPDFFSSAASIPRDMTCNGAGSFSFASPVCTPFAENNRVYGKLFRCAAHWEHRPALILLHGWNAECGYVTLFPRIARRLVSHGVNTAMLELPYHAQRKPTEPGAIRNFISEDLARMVEATRQAVADTRALVHWLK